MRLVAFILSLLLMLIAPQNALSHASLTASMPEDGALLKGAPGVVELAFNEPVEALSLMLVSPQGETVRLDGGRAATNRLRVAVPAGLAQGSHLLSWRVVSADGHPVGGSLVFSIGRASGADAAAAMGTASQITATNPWALVLARWLMLVGLAIGVGGAVFLAWNGARAEAGQHLLWSVSAALATTAAAAIALLALEGLEAHGLTLGSLWRPLTWRTGMRVPQAATTMLATVAMLLAGVGVWIRQAQAAKVLTLLAVIAAGLAMASSGHTSTVQPRWLMSAMVAWHVIAIVAWAGALAPLALVALNQNVALGPLAVFSRHAVSIFAAVVATGIVLAIMQAGSPAALVASVYGRLLLAKLALVALVLGLAAYNRYRLTQPALAGHGLARQRLGRAIAAEALIAVVILGIVAAWRITPPPRALAQMREPKFQIHMHGTDAMASVLIQPARAGPVKVVIEPKTPDLAPLVVKEVTLSLTGEAPGMEPLRRNAKPAGDKWEIDGLTIPVAGRWRVRVELLIDDFERTGLDAVIVVRQ